MLILAYKLSIVLKRSTRNTWVISSMAEMMNMWLPKETP